MKPFYRLIKRRKNVRRLLAGAFIAIAFIEIGLHAFSDSKDLAHFETLGFCGIQHEPPLTADAPTNHKQRGPESNLMDEMTTHAVILNALAVPRAAVSYWTAEEFESIVRPLSGSLSPPFHPPKQA